MEEVPNNNMMHFKIVRNLPTSVKFQLLPAASMKFIVFWATHINFNATTRRYIPQD
jgi:hypothetical protein